MPKNSPAQFYTKPFDIKLSQEAKPRLVYLDNLRVLFVIWVVFHHALRAYAPWWHYAVNEQELSELTPVIGMNFAIMVNGLFFIAGYFTPGSYTKRTGNYVSSRLKRVGAPFLLFACLMPILTYFEHISSHPSGHIGFVYYFIRYYLGFADKPADWDGYGWPDLTYAHFWFLEYLLVFSAGYVVVLQARDKLGLNQHSNSKTDHGTGTGIPSRAWIWLSILSVALVAFIVRLWFPAGVWTVALILLVIEPAHIPINIAFFVLGTIAVKKDWPNKISENDAKFWGVNALIAVAVAFGANIHRPLNHPDNFGGFTLGSALFCIWELYFGISWLISLLWLFRQKYNRSTRFSSWLAANSYVTYMLHGFIILAIQMAFIRISWPVFIKFIVVTIIGVPLSYVSAYIFRKMLPFAKKYW